MNLPVWLDAINALASWVSLTWSISLLLRVVGKVKGSDRFASAAFLYFELMPFYPYAVVASYVLDAVEAGEVTILRTVSTAISLVCWRYWSRNDPDDRWKKRRKKAVEKVARVGGRLVVVPAPSPA